MRTPEELTTISGDDWTPEERQRGAELYASRAIQEADQANTDVQAAMDKADVAGKRALDAIRAARQVILQPDASAPALAPDPAAAVAPVGPATPAVAATPDPAPAAAPPAVTRPPDLGLTAKVAPPSADGSAPAVVGSIAPAVHYGVALVEPKGLTHPDVTAPATDLARVLAGLVLAGHDQAVAAILFAPLPPDADANATPQVAGAAVATAAGWVVRLVAP